MSRSVIHEHLLLVRDVVLENALTVLGTGSDIWKVAIFLLSLGQRSSTSMWINFPSGSYHFSWPFGGMCVCMCMCVYIQRHTQHAYHLSQFCFTTLSWQYHCFSSQPTGGPKSLLSLYLSPSTNPSWWLFLSLENYAFWVLCYRCNYVCVTYTHGRNVCTHTPHTATW